MCSIHTLPLLIEQEACFAAHGRKVLRSSFARITMQLGAPVICHASPKFAAREPKNKDIRPEGWQAAQLGGFRTGLGI